MPGSTVRSIAAFAVLTLGCASSPPNPVEASLENTVWAKTDGSYAAYGDFERAEAACGATEGELPSVSAGPGTRKAWAECMKTQGWARVQLP